MASPPKIVLDEEAVETILALSPAYRRRLLAMIGLLRHDHPHETEDFRETDDTGRHISVKAIRPVLVSYWLDGPVNELRIIRITRIQSRSR